MMRKTVVLIVLIILLTGILAAQEREGSGAPANLLDEDWSTWRHWTHEQKIFYVWGVLSGAQVMAAYIVYGQGYERLEAAVNSFLPEYAVRDYVVAVDYIYERPEFRDEPYWSLIFQLDYYIEERRKYD